MSEVAIAGVGMTPFGRFPDLRDRRDGLGGGRGGARRRGVSG